MPDNPALAAWAARGLHEVPLPSGAVVKIRIPDPTSLIRKGGLPDELLAIAMKFVGQGVDTAQLDADAAVSFAEFVHLVAVSAIHEVKNDAGDFEPVELTVQLADELRLPPEDLDLIAQVALRRITPAQARAAATLEPQPDPEKEADATVEGWGEFRGERPGDQPGGGGRDLRPESGEGLPPDHGPDAGGVGGRGPGGSPPDAAGVQEPAPAGA